MPGRADIHQTQRGLRLAQRRIRLALLPKLVLAVPRAGREVPLAGGDEHMREHEAARARQRVGQNNNDGSPEHLLGQPGQVTRAGFALPHGQRSSRGCRCCRRAHDLNAGATISGSRAVTLLRCHKWVQIRRGHLEWVEESARQVEWDWEKERFAPGLPARQVRSLLGLSGATTAQNQCSELFLSSQ